MIPYTYLIGWSGHNKFYYGVRYAKKAHPSDLFVTYFTSSTRVHKLIKEVGEPDIIEVRRTFQTKEAAIAWEAKTLRRNKCHVKEHFLNMQANGTLFGLMDDEANHKRRTANLGRACTEETKKKIGAALKGRVRTQEERNNLSRKLKGRKIWNKGRALSPNHIAKLRESALKRNAMNRDTRASP